MKVLNLVNLVKFKNRKIITHSSYLEGDYIREKFESNKFGKKVFSLISLILGQRKILSFYENMIIL